MFRAFFLVILAGLLFGCKPRPNVQGMGETVLQGVWQQDSLEHAEVLRSYTLYDFKFTCDSFYVTMNVHASLNYQQADTCFSKDGWKEYAKGVYAMKQDTLILSGLYTKSNFKQKISGCFNSGNYKQDFLLKKTEKDKLYLENMTSNLPFVLNLKQAITCTPKAR